MLPTDRPNFVDVSRTRYKVEQAWYRDRERNQVQYDPLILGSTEERDIPSNTGLVYVLKTLHITIDSLLDSLTA
jgi:hypothetical protein